MVRALAMPGALGVEVLSPAGVEAEFLRGYGWDRADDFGRRALQGVQEFQFDAISRISEMVDLTKVKDLGQLADRRFG
jgi:hypothetical protein